jgi:7-cyano-7-deazaguanine synthase in queuosine biosynthesis
MTITAFINLSGGVDSTYYLWRWLREHPNEMIQVHHCMFLKRRLTQEKNACTNILNYFRSVGLKNFRYVETGIQRGTLQGKILDIELLSGNTGVALKLVPSINTVLLPYCKEETSALDNHLKAGGTIETYDHSHRYWKVNQIYELLAGKKFQYHFYRSLEDGGLLSKREMPKELFENTWYCRRPKEGDKVCGKCHTCRKVTRALEYIRNVKT